MEALLATGQADPMAVDRIGRTALHMVSAATKDMCMQVD